MLHRAGEIELPAVRQVSLNPLARREPPAPMLIDTTPITGTLSEIQPIDLQQVRRTADEPLFNSLMEHHHYLAYEQPVGEHLKYLAWGLQEGQPRPIACVAWSSAPRHLGSRDRYNRMECGSAAPEHPLHCIQYAFSDPALGDGSSSGLASARAHGPSAIAGLGARLRAPHLFSGDLRGPGTVSGNLLPRSQLGAAGAHDRARQRRPHQSSEPLH